MLRFIAILVLLAPLATWAQRWNSSNNPLIIQKNFELKFESLPLEGTVADSRLAWPGYHWMNYLGGIANRWSAASSNNFTYKSPSLADLKKMDPSDLNQLSPAEKFDIFLGDYKYSTVRKVRSQTSPNENVWHGICHGYTAAAMHHPEPESTIVRNEDGVELKFYSSDIQALLAYYYAKVSNAKVALVGRRCNASPERASSSRYAADCWDINAGAFHVIMTNLMGLQGGSFIADLSRFNEVWNHVASAYNGSVLSEGAPIETSAPGTLKRVLVDMNVKYAAPSSPKFDAVIGTELAEYVTVHYQYWLDLGPENKILGGEWHDGAQPDFVWVQAEAVFSGKWSKIKDFYQYIQTK